MATHSYNWTFNTVQMNQEKNDEVILGFPNIATVQAKYLPALGAYVDNSTSLQPAISYVAHNFSITLLSSGS